MVNIKITLFCVDEAYLRLAPDDDEDEQSLERVHNVAEVPDAIKNKKLNSAIKEIV